MNTRVFIPSGAGSPGFGGILTCLKQEDSIQVYSGDCDPNPYGKELSDGFVLMPRSLSETYISHVISACEKFSCDVVLPITTGELTPLAFHSHELEEKNIHVLVSPFESIKTANNKHALYQILEKHNLPVADYMAASGKQDVLKAAKTLGAPNIAVIIKPSVGNGSRGFRIIAPLDEVSTRYFENKAGSLYTSMEALSIEMPETFENEYLVCEYLPGTEYSVDILANRGETTAIAVRIREKTISGISVRGTFIRDESMEQVCTQIVKLLSLHGPIGIQFKRDSNGVAKVLEINPRLQGAVSASLFADINFPLLAVKMALGQHFSGCLTIKKEVSFNRYWNDIISKNPK